MLEKELMSKILVDEDSKDFEKVKEIELFSFL